MFPVAQVTLQRNRDARIRERLQTVVRIGRNREVPHSCEDDGGSFTCFWGIDLSLGTLELFLAFPFWSRLLVWLAGASANYIVASSDTRKSTKPPRRCRQRCNHH